MKKVSVLLAVVLMGCGAGVDEPTRAMSASAETAAETGVVSWEAYDRRIVGKTADGVTALDVRVSGKQWNVVLPEVATVNIDAGIGDLGVQTRKLLAAYIADDGNQGLPEGVQAVRNAPDPMNLPPLPPGACPEGCAVALLRSCNGIVTPPSCSGADPTLCCILAYTRCCS